MTTLRERMPEAIGFGHREQDPAGRFSEPEPAKGTRNMERKAWKGKGGLGTPDGGGPDRRKVLQTAAGALAFQVLPGRVWSQSPNETLNLGFIGAGGRGQANIRGCGSESIHALCDVDERRCARMVGQYPSARFYRDWRDLLDREGEKLDAVVVSTPDHTHAVAAMAAIRLGKHVYVEKPLTHTISEARALREAAGEAGVCTQMGNTGHAREGARRTNEFIRSGALGEVTEVHCVTNRPIWPQDTVRGPAAPVPGTLDWDLWLGPAPEKPYAKGIVPFKWRGYLDYGTGALGDMGAHIIDHPVWALQLGAPESVEVQCDREHPESHLHTYPASSTITYRFPARGKRPPVKLVWYDGDHELPRPPGLGPDEKNLRNGCVYYGSKHVMMHGSHGGTPRILTNAQDFEGPPRTMERSPGHYREWIEGIKAGDPSRAKSNFEVAGPLTELILLGCIATRAGSGVRIGWDPATLKTGNAEVDAHVHHDYRKGWTL